VACSPEAVAAPVGVLEVPAALAEAVPVASRVEALDMMVPMRPATVVVAVVLRLTYQAILEAAAARVL
jgi:hypothetical protein